MRVHAAPALRHARRKPQQPSVEEELALRLQHVEAGFLDADEIECGGRASQLVLHHVSRRAGTRLRARRACSPAARRSSAITPAPFLRLLVEVTDRRRLRRCRKNGRRQRRPRSRQPFVADEKQHDEKRHDLVPDDRRRDRERRDRAPSPAPPRRRRARARRSRRRTRRREDTPAAARRSVSRGACRTFRARRARARRRTRAR